MGIVFNEKKRIFTLYTKHTMYQMMADGHGVLLHLYYGRRIQGEMDYLLTYHDRGFSGNPADVYPDRSYSLDALPQEFPVRGNGDFRNCALSVENGDGSIGCDLRYKSHEIRNGKYGLNGLPAVYAAEDEAQTLEIVLEDVAFNVSGLRVRLLYSVLPEMDIITRSAVVENAGLNKIYILKAASACLDFIYGDYDMMTFYGRHAMERNLERMPIGHGSKTIGSIRGTSSHQSNPAMIIARPSATETMGDCYGLVFVYSGGFAGEASKDQLNQTRVLMGLQGEMFRYPLAHGESLTVPETVLTFSSHGFSQLSVNYHRCFRKHLCRGAYRDRIRPVLLNSWEASYFNFDKHSIWALAQKAADLGVELLVLDDGWFGHRNDDNSSLGDWYVNEEKLGCTLGQLIAGINAVGLKFGLWVEPEMISEDSQLYKNHPDWVLAIPGRAPVRSRNQLVLDFSRQDVRDFIFESLCRVLDQGRVDYIKWDMNRSLSDVYSRLADGQGRVYYDYMLGVYDFLEKLLKRYPEMLIEGCSGGGGRFDAGMLYYTPQIWCSDNTDAIDRVYIQYGTSFFYPCSAVGAHVSASPNHQTGRVTPLNTRGVVAMAGTFGYELNPDILPPEAQEEIASQIQTYHRYAPLMAEGDYYRLTNPWENENAAWMFVSQDRSEALVSIVVLDVHGNMPVSYISLAGLDEARFYKDGENQKIYSGAALMNGGFPVPVKMGAYRSYQIHLEAL